MRDTEILPLYARLSAAEQHRVFQPHTGRRVVLATNVAETSLTVPGIKYVIDPGTARISRYSHRLKVQRLPIEPISQASANQRKGRCGRTSDGICIRLYDEEDFLSRPEFTEPEILRTNLASVILQMTAIGLGDIAAFPFIDPPDRRNIADGVDLLQELGALDPTETDLSRRLTPLGRKLAQLPVDPRLARMVLEADRNGCVPEVHGDRRRAVHPGPAGAAGRHSRRRPTRRTPGSPTRSRTSSRYLNLWQLPAGAAEGAVVAARSAGCAGPSSSTTCGSASGRTSTASSARWPGRSAWARPATPDGPRPRIHQSLLAGLLSHIGDCKRAADEAASTSAPAAPSSPSSPARRCSGSRRAG